MKYVLLFCGTLEGQRAYDGLSPEELGPRLEQAASRWRRPPPRSYASWVGSTSPRT
jgi:hypothetical protein